MERSVSLWFFLLCILVWALLTVAFGWMVVSTLSGSDRTGALGRAAVEVASFPATTKRALKGLVAYLEGEQPEEGRSVRRDENVDYSGFEPVATALPIDVPGLLMRVHGSGMQPGWRVLVGAFQIDDDVENAVLVLSPDLKIVKTWTLDEVPVDGQEPQPKHRKFVHGIEFLRDGSIIFTFDGSISLQRFGPCGERDWTIGGNFHHAVTLDDGGESVWTFTGEETIVEVAVRDGAILREISVEQIIDANPMTDILEIRRNHENDANANARNTIGEWLPNPHHFNDVDPLPAALADRFEGFEAGDLLVSARSLNLVFVLDPETLEIKWWRIGPWQRQHDPDWVDDGTIMVLNNRMSRDFSNVIKIDPATFHSEVALDGQKHMFYTRIRGKINPVPNGGFMISSPQQGRAFEVDPDGNTLFEVVNLKPGSTDTNYVISEMRWFPLDFFDMEAWQCAKDN